MPFQYFSKWGEVRIAYSEAIAILKNKDHLVQVVEFHRSRGGHEVDFHLTDGRVLTCFTTDPNLHDRLLENIDIKVLENEPVSDSNWLGVLFAFAISCLALFGGAFLLKEFFSSRDQDNLRRMG